jgi:acyl-coenzyme A thioesterase PaaI-like protein
MRTPRLRRALLRLMSFYPPFLGAGIRVVRVAPDQRTYEVRMRLTRWNRNYVGTHFGGSLYAMCDPFYMLILIEALGPGYAVWDKAATIRFRRPGRGTVRARFHIPEERLAAIRAEADAAGRAEPRFTVEVRDREGEVVAEVEKLLSVRRRTPLGGPEPAPVPQGAPG